MIQEKDFLYRVPVKTAPITTPRGQIRNPEILVDLEGGEFMHGNILDANSTNKLINQSVKDAVDDKFIESGYVTKDLLEAETSARTKSDEGLSAKIKAEQTRAEGKEKEISDKLAIVDGDSNTEGSFRKAIADVIAAAPEDLDTLKEIADKLAGNDDLHTALNQAITEKADASALANEVTRATGAESNLQAAISAKQNAGNYIPYDDRYKQAYIPDRTLRTIGNNIEAYSIGGNDQSILQPGNILVEKIDGNSTHTAKLNIEGLTIRNAYKDIYIDKDGFRILDSTGNHGIDFIIQKQGISLKGGDNNHVLTSNSGTIDITQYALKRQLDTKVDTEIVDALVAQLTDIETNVAGKQDKGDYVAYSSEDDNNYYFHKGFASSKPFVVDDSDGNEVEYGIDGIIDLNHPHRIPTTDGVFKPISDFVLKTELTGEVSDILDDYNFMSQQDGDSRYALAATADSLSVGLSKKQDKITVNEVDITDIKTADITKLRTIVTNLINALSKSNLIRKTETLE